MTWSVADPSPLMTAGPVCAPNGLGGTSLALAESRARPISLVQVIFFPYRRSRGLLQLGHLGGRALQLDAQGTVQLFGGTPTRPWRR